MSLHTCYLCYFIAHPYRPRAKRPPNEAEEFKKPSNPERAAPSQTSPELGSGSFGDLQIAATYQ